MTQCAWNITNNFRTTPIQGKKHPAIPLNLTSTYTKFKWIVCYPNYTLHIYLYYKFFYTATDFDKTTMEEIYNDSNLINFRSNNEAFYH